MSLFRVGFGAMSLGALLLSGCAGVGTVTSTTSGNATMNLVVSDTPPTGVTVLSFQVQITGAVLAPGNVSILPRPVTVDLAQLATDTGILASTVIGSGTYTSMTMTMANPLVTLMNNTSGTLSLNGQSCVAGATCTYVPVLNTASLTISNGVFPINVTAGSSTGLDLDLSIPDLLQSDLSVTLASGKAVSLSLLPAPLSGTAQAAEIDDILGTVTAVSGSTVTITTAFGDTLILTESSATKYKYPAAVCQASAASCVAVGQAVTTDLGLLGNGGIAVTTLSYAGAANAQVVKGLVLSVNTTASTAQVLVQRELNVASLTTGQIATVTLPAASGYAIGTVTYPTATGATFGSALDLLPGQELMLNVGSGLVTGTSPAFTASAVYLESSQIVGEIASVSSATLSITENDLNGLFTMSRPIVQQMKVQTDGTTEFSGFTVSSFSGLAAGQFFSAKGPLFNTVGTQSVPTVSAIQLRSRLSGN